MKARQDQREKRTDLQRVRIGPSGRGRAGRAGQKTNRKGGPTGGKEGMDSGGEEIGESPLKKQPQRRILLDSWRGRKEQTSRKQAGKRHLSHTLDISYPVDATLSQA